MKQYSMAFAFRGATEVLRTLFLISCGFLAQPILHAHAQSMASSTRSDEFDTADRSGGQIGGTRLGINYRLVTMRCDSGQAIVGAYIRRGDVLNYMQITCATPSCANGFCAWSSPHPGMSAGDSSSGDAQPAMMCPTNEILSGIRGIVHVFRRRAGFDYAADVEIACSQMTSAAVSGSSGTRFHPVSIGAASWHHADPRYTSGPLGGSRDLIEDSMTGPISCGSRGYGATAVSAAVSSFLPGEPAVQAVSLYCPRISPTAARQRPQESASIGGRKRRQSSLDFGSAVESSQKSGSIASPPLAASGSAESNDFRLMTPQDSMWANKDYAGTLGYFAAESNALSGCHGFIGEMGVATPGANLCGNGFMQNLPHLPAGIPHQLGDIALVEDRSARAPWHSAIFIGCTLYLQRNGRSNIQVISQSYIDNFTSSETVFYVRPIGLGTFRAKLAALKAAISPAEGTTTGDQSRISQIKGCFPN